MSVFSSTGSHSLQDESEPVYSVHQDHIATIVLNRPEKLNAITSSMWKRLHQSITTLSGDDSLRCIVIRSSCAKAFSPGCDIDEFAKCRSDKSQAQAYGRLMHDTLNAFWHCPIPVVAEIRGICIGAGLEIASTCDFRIASETCRLGAPVKNLGLVMAYPELEPLLQLAGKDVALEMLLEGKIFNADEALQKRLLTRVVPDDQLADTVARTVSNIVSGAPLAARWHKKFIRRLTTDISSITPEEYDECFDCFDTEDFRTGCRSFLRHIHPVFKGK